VSEIWKILDKESGSRLPLIKVNAKKQFFINSWVVKQIHKCFIMHVRISSQGSNTIIYSQTHFCVFICFRHL